MHVCLKNVTSNDISDSGNDKVVFSSTPRLRMLMGTVSHSPVFIWGLSSGPSTLVQTRDTVTSYMTASECKACTNPKG